jgi:diaminopropionate ammonia-lyase
MQGYRLMVDEALDQWAGPPPTHAFIQAGVGGIAAAVSIQLRARLGTLPTLVVVEPDSAACLLTSAERGALTPLSGPLDTSMDCLACGKPSLLAWQELERSARAFIAIGDETAAKALVLLAELDIASQPSGAAGLGGLLAVADDAPLRAALTLDTGSRVLLFNTEGALG